MGHYRAEPNRSLIHNRRPVPGDGARLHRNRPPDWRAFLLELTETDERQITALIETLGWLPLDTIRDPLLQLLQAPNPVHQRIGFVACVRQRADMGNYLNATLQSDCQELRICALKAVGELGRIDLLPILRQHLATEPPEWRFWAAWSAVSMGKCGQSMEIELLVRRQYKLTL